MPHSHPLPAPGPVAVQAAKDCLRADVLAVREVGGNNRGKWVRAILAYVDLAVGNPWCAAFAYARLKKASTALGKPLPAWVPKSGYTPTWVNAAKREGLFFTTAQARLQQLAQPGDLAFFYGTAAGGVKRIKHVGVVVASHTWGVETVEGNTGPDPTPGQPNADGDGVYLKSRTWHELGDASKSGFVRLPF